MIRRTAVLSSSVLVLALASPAYGTSQASSLDARLAQLLAGSGSTGLSVRVDVAGRTVFSHSPARTVSPASTEKLITGFTALRVLGPAHRFVTRLGSTAPPDRQGVIRGQLVLTASGDPTLSTAGLDTLAAQVRHDGVRSVTGGLVLDDSALSRVRRAPGWKPAFVPDELGPLSAFSVNGNACGWTSAGRCAATPGYLADPDLGNLQALRNALTRAGVAVVGPLSTSHETAHPLASVASAPLSAIVHEMLKESVNFDAELLLEDLGATAGDGSPAGGVRVIRAQAAALGVSLGGNIVDGSGLSIQDAMSADAEVAWLEAAQRSRTLWPVLSAALPIGCVDGTLAARTAFCGMANPVHAKTGTLDGMRALTGWVVDAAGHQVTFAFLIGGPLSSATAGKTAIDRSVLALAASHL